jgi:hypothetical protein
MKFAIPGFLYLFTFSLQLTDGGVPTDAEAFFSFVEDVLKQYHAGKEELIVRKESLHTLLARPGPLWHVGCNPARWVFSHGRKAGRAEQSGGAEESAKGLRRQSEQLWRPVARVLCPLTTGTTLKSTSSTASVNALAFARNNNPHTVALLTI